jgi:hypothetical protein
MINEATNKMGEKLLDPVFYLSSFCKIKGKEGKGLIPFNLKPAQLDIMNVVQRNNRVIIMKSRQIGFCVSPNTKILSSSLEWITADDIRVGQGIVSVDEFPIKKGRGGMRKMREGVIEAKSIVYENAFKLKMDNGTELIATGPHRFLSLKNNIETEWRKVDSMSPGDSIRYITKPHKKPNFEDGWFGGMIDGEGSLSQKTRTGSSLSISQVDGLVWDNLIKYVEKNDYNYRIEVDRRTPQNSGKYGQRPVNKLMIGRMDELMRLFSTVRPIRLINRRWWIDKQVPNNGWSKIVSIESLGKRKMIDLQTSEKTFIANGFISHNSTVMTGYLYHKTITTPGVTTAIVGYNNDLTAELLDKIKTFYRTTPDALKPTIHYNSKYEVSFPKVDSKVLVLPSTENVGRGYTINYALLTEVPFWEKAEDKLVTLEASVPVTGKIIIESSPGAVGDYFHRMWVSENDYIKKEYGWWWNYTEEEIEIIKRRMNNPRKFNNNYALEFLISGRAVFTQEAITLQRKNVLKVGDSVKLEDGTEHIVREEEGFRIYKPPVEGHFYVIGADCSEGVTGGDYSVCSVIDRTNGEEVGFWRGHIAPDRYAKVLNKWGRHYNNALMVVEAEAHGNVVLNVLKNLLYPSLYFRPSKFETVANSWSDKLGWKTTKLTRPILIDEFEQMTREGDITIRSKETVDEMTVFIFNQANNMCAMESYHDDCVFATAIACQGFKVISDKPMTQLSYAQHLPTSGY